MVVKTQDAALAGAAVVRAVRLQDAALAAEAERAAVGQARVQPEAALRHDARQRVLHCLIRVHPNVRAAPLGEQLVRYTVLHAVSSQWSSFGFGAHLYEYIPKLVYQLHFTPNSMTIVTQPL